MSTQGAINKGFRNEVEAHFNEPILYGTEIARVIGYGEDDYDCYIIIHCPNRGVLWHSMVGGYFYLTALDAQNRIVSHDGDLWSDLTRLSGNLEVAGCLKRDEFIVERR